MRTILFSIIALVLSALSASAVDGGVSFYVNKYYSEWNRPGLLTVDDALGLAILGFYNNVPPSVRGGVLEQILERAMAARPNANYQVIEVVLMYVRIINGAYGSVVLSSKFQHDLLLLSKDSLSTVRRDAVAALAILDKRQFQDIIKNALTDPDGEVRAAAIEALIMNPEAVKSCEQYISKHQSNPDSIASVQLAKVRIDE